MRQFRSSRGTYEKQDGGRNTLHCWTLITLSCFTMHCAGCRCIDRWFFPGKYTWTLAKYNNTLSWGQPYNNLDGVMQHETIRTQLAIDSQVYGSVLIRVNGKEERLRIWSSHLPTAQISIKSLPFNATHSAREESLAVLYPGEVFVFDRADIKGVVSQTYSSPESQKIVRDVNYYTVQGFCPITGATFEYPQGPSTAHQEALKKWPVSPDWNGVRYTRERHIAIAVNDGKCGGLEIWLNGEMKVTRIWSTRRPIAVFRAMSVSDTSTFFSVAFPIARVEARYYDIGPAKMSAELRGVGP